MCIEVRRGKKVLTTYHKISRVNTSFMMFSSNNQNWSCGGSLLFFFHLLLNVCYCFVKLWALLAPTCFFLWGADSQHHCLSNFSTIEQFEHRPIHVMGVIIRLTNECNCGNVRIKGWSSVWKTMKNGLKLITLFCYILWLHSQHKTTRRKFKTMCYSHFGCRHWSPIKNQLAYYLCESWEPFSKVRVIHSIEKENNTIADNLLSISCVPC